MCKECELGNWEFCSGIPKCGQVLFQRTCMSECWYPEFKNMGPPAKRSSALDCQAPIFLEEHRFLPGCSSITDSLYHVFVSSRCNYIWAIPFISSPLSSFRYRWSDHEVLHSRCFLPSARLGTFQCSCRLTAGVWSRYHCIALRFTILTEPATLYCRFDAAVIVLTHQYHLHLYEYRAEFGNHRMCFPELHNSRVIKYVSTVLKSNFS